MAGTGAGTRGRGRCARRGSCDVEEAVGVGALGAVPAPACGLRCRRRSLTRHVNETGADHKRDHPGRFGHFASLPLPDVDATLDELAYFMDQFGSDGVTVKTNAHGIYLGDPRFEPLLAELGRCRTPVFVHPLPAPRGVRIPGPSAPHRTAHVPIVWKSRRSSTNPRSSRLGWTRFVSRIA
ncbi:amidohydrolase family protein [Streptomyces sp. NPDC005786]|uniref:amidohydrolase family protein n=1 Tax=Streptomyces sp. NPDC005786 TaxID=3154891 RepID=UPI0033FF7812